MRNKRAWHVIGLTSVLLLALWLLFACVAPPGEEAAAAPRELRNLQGETCKTFTSTDVSKAIPDKGLEIPLGAFTTSKVNAALAGYITDLTVTFTIDHAKPSDLQIVLCGPRNLNCQILNRDLTNTGGEYTLTFSSDPTHASFGDLAAGPPYTGSYPSDDIEPAGLGKFRNAAAAGEWRLALLDLASSNVGSLSAWSLELCAIATKYTPTPTIAGATAVPASECGSFYYHPKSKPTSAVSLSENTICGDIRTPNATVRAVYSTAVPASQQSWSFSGAGSEYDNQFPEPQDPNYGGLIFCPRYNYTYGSAAVDSYAAGDSVTFGSSGNMLYTATRGQVPFITGRTSGACSPYPSRWAIATLAGSGNWTVTSTTDRYIAFSRPLGYGVQTLADSVCLGGSSHNQDWNFTIGGCYNSTPAPTATPTRPCPTAIANKTGWWMW